MATTTNYGWETPDDTDLVKDGASAIRTLGSSIDTTTKALNPSTTAGDIEFRSAVANTNSRLGIGTAGQVLTVNSGATAPEWTTLSTGGMTLISSTTLSGSSVVLSSIPTTYKNLQLVVRSFIPSADGNYYSLRLNGDTSTKYKYTTGNSANTGWSDSSVKIATSTDDTVAKSLHIIDLYDYTNTSTWKLGQSLSLSVDSTDGASIWWERVNFFYDTISAITSITLFVNAGTFAGGTALLYGVK